MFDKALYEKLASLKTGDRVKIVFANRPIDKGKLLMVVCRFQPMGDALDVGELPFYNLSAVAQSGKWEGFRTYTATVLEGYDKNLAGRLAELLESVSHA